MLQCYLLALCSGTSIDRDTNNFTLFNVVETLRLPPAALGQAVPVDVHFFWIVDSQAFNQEFEIRLVRVNEAGEEDFGSSIPFIPKDKNRWRVRVPAFRLPREFGNYTLRAQWRLKGRGDWVTESARWPLDLLEAPGELLATPDGAVPGP